MPHESEGKIILLDLNVTLSTTYHRDRGKPMRDRIDNEAYRLWLVDYVRRHYTILVTARWQAWEERTLARIAETTSWQPQESYFNQTKEHAPDWKARALRRIMAQHGADVDQCCAGE